MKYVKRRNFWVPLYIEILFCSIQKLQYICNKLISEYECLIFEAFFNPRNEYRKSKF